MKPKTGEGLRLDSAGYKAIVEEVMGKNYAGIQTMAKKWGLSIRPDHKTEPPQARSFWRKKLGHDVLMHPGTHKPCALPDGAVLVYKGIIEKIATKVVCEFVFALPSGDTLTQSTFPTTT